MVIYLCAIILVAAAIIFVVWAWPPAYGIDLGGGLSLVYQVDRTPANSAARRLESLSESDRAALVQAARQRLDPGRTREVDVRFVDDWAIEISLPQVKATELDELQRRLAAAGVLEFRVVANRGDPRHENVISLAEQQAENAEDTPTGQVVDGDQVVGTWVMLSRPSTTQQTAGADGAAIGVVPPGAVMRDGETGQLIELPETLDTKNVSAVEQHLRETGARQIELLLVVDKKFRFTGDDLISASAGFDEYLAPCIDLRASSRGAKKLEALTRDNLPDEKTSTYNHLAIVFDGQVVSAPRIVSPISDACRITGDFTRADVDFLVDVLRAGRLPVPLEKNPAIGTIPASQQARHLVGFTLLIVLVLLAVWWCSLTLRYRPLGTGAALTSMLQTVGIGAAILVLGLWITPALLFASTAMLLITLMGLFWVVAPFKRGSVSGGDSDGMVTPILRRRGIPLVVLLGVLAAASFVAQAVGDFAVRSVATPLLLGSILALPAFFMCVILPALVPAPAETCDAMNEPRAKAVD
jgi:SecD/SecF fusion protein